MNLSAPFIHRPVATTLITVGIALAGLLGFQLLPIAPLPQVDFPTISVSASLPGANPDTMAATVSTPLERAALPSSSISPAIRAPSANACRSCCPQSSNASITSAIRG